jgi:phosphate:Na+ symporter
LVQSSSAVTVASIGFVNAGMLSLRHAVWVIFGSNVGTTMNAWLVATLGFSVKIDAFALPFIGIGSILSLTARTVRPVALGQALAGFGVLFLGIDVLKDSFSVFGENLHFDQFIMPGIAGWALLVAIGTLLTVLMQASGAAIAIVITAAQGGLMSIEAACAMVIGTNIGTTSTAVLSALGATANARRLAAAHVFFNLITGAAALLLLPLLIGLLGAVRDALAQPATPAVMIALFHSIFNVLGVLLMVPATPWLLRTLSRRFRSREEESARPQHIDMNSVSVPDLALRALGLELDRTQSLANHCLTYATATPPNEIALASDRGTLVALAASISAFVTRLTSANLPAVLVDKLARSLRVLQYQENTAATCQQATELAAILGPMPTRELDEAYSAFQASVGGLSAVAETSQSELHSEALERHLQETEDCYARLKETLLMAGAHGTLNVHKMQERLRHASLIRRAAEQTAKAARHLAAVRADVAAPKDPVTDEGVVDAETE